MSANPIFDPFDHELGVRRREVRQMSEDLRTQAADAADQLYSLVLILRSVARGQLHEAGRLRPYVTSGKNCPDFLFLDIDPGLERLIRSESDNSNT